jgi:hypothetical protein
VSLSSTGDSSNDPPEDPKDPKDPQPPKEPTPGPGNPLLPNDPRFMEEQLLVGKKELDSAYLRYGEKLFKAFAADNYNELGFKTYDEWLDHLGIDADRARRLRRIFKVFQKDIGTPLTRLLKIGFTNLSVILPVVEHEKNKADDWLHKAEMLPTRELEALVEKMKPPSKRRKVVIEVPGTHKFRYKPGETVIAPPDPKIAKANLKPSKDGKTNAAKEETVYKKTFYLIDEQNTVLETALETMERKTGSSKVGYLLSMILLEWLANNGAKDTADDENRQFVLAMLEQRYKGKALWIKNLSLVAKLKELLDKAEGNDVQDGKT